MAMSLAIDLLLLPGANPLAIFEARKRQQDQKRVGNFIAGNLCTRGKERVSADLRAIANPYCTQQKLKHPS
jgi:hypothetical protein